MKRARAPSRSTPALAVGITGHRPPVLMGDNSPDERARLAHVLRTLRDSAVAVVEAHADLFDGTQFVSRLVSPLAEGADQIAAEVALSMEYRLNAVLPLPAENYRADFSADGVARFDALLGEAETVIEFPAERGGREIGYELAGRATVAHCDVLIAVWDGEPARGSGGTAEIVALALRQGVPVIHIPVGPVGMGRVLWTGYGEFVDHSDLIAIPERALDHSALRGLVEALLGPPAGAGAQADLLKYLRERERRIRARTEYPLLLMLLGVKRMRASAFAAPRYERATSGEWKAFRETCITDRHGVTVELGALERSFGWADMLAQHFAQTYRSGHILNFSLAALAVLVALAGLLFPSFHLSLAIAEPLAIVLLVLNTWVGTRCEWHRRWLEYRQLAERIRPMRSLKLLGIARPPFWDEDDFRGKISWIDWYARGEWRRLGCPSGRLADPDALVRAIVSEEIEGQIRYHRSNAQQMHLLDYRLHAVGMILFVISILGCAMAILANLVVPQVVAEDHTWFVALSAGLPALGAAIFGIRMQGDFDATAERSLLTAQKLQRIADLLTQPGIGFARQADLVEAAAAAMLSELGEWRRAYARRSLELP